MIYNIAKWERASGKFDKKYSLIKVEDSDHLQLFLSSNDSFGENIILDYSNCRVCSYLFYDESFWVPPLYSYMDKYGGFFIANSTFFEVIDSQQKKNISEWGFCGKFKPEEFLHLMLFTTDVIFEIVSYGAPVLSIS